MTSAAPPTEFFPGINFNPSFYNLGQSAVTLDYLQSNYLRSTGYAISRAQYTLFNGAVDIKQNLDVSGNVNAKAYFLDGVPFTADQWTKVNDDIYNNNTGNVGIGKTNPTYKLDVSGSMNVSDSLRIGEVLIEEYIRNYLATDTPEFEQINIPKLLIKANYGPFLELQKQDGESIYSAFVYISPLNPAMFCFDAGGAGGANTALHFRTRGDEKLIISDTFNIFYNPIKFANNNDLIFNGSYNQLTDKLTGDGTTVTINNGVISVTGSTYTDTNVRTVLSNSAGTNIVWNSTTNKFDVAAPYTDTNTRTVLSNSAGSNMTWNTGTNKFDVAAPYTDANTRTVVASSAGQGLAWNITTNKLDATYSYTLPTASTSVLGGVKIDNTTIAINASGTISLSGNEILLKGGTNNMYYGWAGSDSMLGRAGTNLGYFVGVAVDDIVLRSAGRLVLMTGTTTPALVINSGNVGIGKTNPSEKLHCAGSILAGINIYADNEWSRLGIGINPSTSSGNVVHLHRALTNTEVKIQLTDSTTGIGTTDGIAIYKATDQNGYLWNYEPNALIFGTNNTEKMRILSGGNVGIGITNPPFALLHLHKTALAQDVRIQFTDGTTGAASTDGLVIGKGTNGRNFIYNYENSDLYFATNTLERMTISGAGNVGIANTAPIAPLTIGNSALANNDGFLVLEKCTTVGTTRQFRIGLNANFDLAMGDYGGNNVAGTWLESFKISYQSPANALVINSSGNIGVNTSNPTSKVHINHSSTSTSPDSGGSIALYVNNPTNLLNNNSIICNRVAGILCGKVIYSLDVYGAHGWSIYITAISNVFRINNSYTASGTDVLTIDQAGNATIYGSIAGTGIISSSFLQGSGAGGAYRIVRPDTWVRLKNTADTDHLDFAAGRLYAHYQLDVVGAATFSAFTIHNAEVRVRMQSVSNTANEYVCIKTTGGATDGALGNYYDKILYIAYNTFTGFHRCYVEDELCNDDNIDIFKNDFVGRIVISTGKIKTDASRKKIIENQLEDTPDEYEWYSLEDKEGITIEDALPKVQLSRIRKDKRVYGVLGEPNRGTNNKDRIIVNGCGEGAICVCNRNGNIENGDYIQTSDLLGYGEKQDDDIHRNYTVAKAVMDCSFELDSPYYQCEELASGVRVAIIACVYKAS